MCIRDRVKPAARNLSTWTGRLSVVTVPAFPPSGLVSCLEERGFSLSLLVEDVAFGRDYRLLVTAPDSALRVELLGPLAGVLEPPVWHAVRAADGERAVWCGPPRTCGLEVLRRYVSELLSLPFDELSLRWQRLG